MKSLTQNHLAGEWPGQVVRPDYLFSEPTTTEPDLHQQSGADAQRGTEKLKVRGGEQKDQANPRAPHRVLAKV